MAVDHDGCRQVAVGHRVEVANGVFERAHDRAQQQHRRYDRQDDAKPHAQAGCPDQRVEQRQAGVIRVAGSLELVLVERDRGFVEGAVQRCHFLHRQRLDPFGVALFHRGGQREQAVVEVARALDFQGLGKLGFHAIARHGQVALPFLVAVVDEALGTGEHLADVGGVGMEHGAVESEARAVQEILGIIDRNTGGQLVRVDLFQRAMVGTHAIEAEQADGSDQEAEHRKGGDQSETDGKCRKHGNPG